MLTSLDQNYYCTVVSEGRSRSVLQLAWFHLGRVLAIPSSSELTAIKWIQLLRIPQFLLDQVETGRHAPPDR